MDNRRIDISLHGKQSFDLAMQLASISNPKTVGFRIHKNHLVLYWSESTNADYSKLPYVMNVPQVTEFAWGWLNSVEPTQEEQDHDGHNGKGFRVFNEAWGHVFGEWQGYIAITPIWAMFGK